MDEILRIYDPESECGKDGYPFAWHRSTAYGGYPAGHSLSNPAIKDLVRLQGEHRCERCGHPYPPGIAINHPRGEWTPCDSQCTHPGPVRSGLTGRHFSDREPTPEGPIEAQWRILTVHHLNGTKWDCRWWNLAALCQRCHLTIQGKVLMERVYPLEHTEWFKPHAAGWYASAYLGEDLTREETMERLDELLALERVA